MRDVNDRGDVIFEGYVRGTGAIYIGQPNALRLLAMEGTPAPGLPAGTVNRARSVALNDRGDYTFSIDLNGGSSTVQAVYAGNTGGAPTLLAGVGQRATGTEPGVAFKGFGVPAINADGQVAFFANLTGTDLSAGADQGIFATDPSGVLRLVVREGDLFPVAPGDLRRIAGFAPSDFSALKFEGPELAFRADFTDGSSGEFTARVVPEPAALAAGLLPALLLFRRRRP